MKRSKLFMMTMVGILVLLASTMSAQVPSLMNYQGFLKDPNTNQPITDSKAMTFSLYSVSTGGSALWTETHTVAVENGYFSIILGSITPLPYSVVGSGDLYLGVQVASDAEMTPRKQMVSVSFSLKSHNSELLEGMSASDFSSSTHNHLGAFWDNDVSTDPALRIHGNVPWNNAVVLVQNNNSGPGIWGVNYGTGNGVRGYNGASGIGVFGQSESGNAVVGLSTDGHGLRGESTNGPGAEGTSTNGYGLKAFSTNNYGLYAESGDVGDTYAGYFKGPNGIRTQVTTGVYSALLDNVVRITGSGWHGIQIDNTGWAGIWVDNAGIDGFEVSSAGRHGLHVHSANDHGVLIEGTVTGNAIQIDGAASHGIHIANAGSNGVDVAAAEGDGMKVYSSGMDGLHVNSAGQNGVQVKSAGWSGVYVASSTYDAIRVQTSGQDGLRFFEGIGRDYIRAGSDADLDFRVTNTGAAYADGGFNGAADFAEMIETDAMEASYEPGDVMAISPDKDRSVTLSKEACSTAIIGVYSTKPGFIGSTHPTSEQYDNEIPVAITGIVPCKVTTENGSIKRGDLLTSSSKPGYAMKATDPQIGTILGKAMGTLENGTGVIEILVILQ